MTMLQSSQRRKQRKYRYTAPMHVRQKFVHVHVSKELRAKLGIKKRSIQVRKGDTVKVMVGSNRGKSGKVGSVNMKSCVLTIDGVMRKNAKGRETPVPIRTSNVYITDIDTSDKFRRQVLGIKQ